MAAHLRWIGLKKVNACGLQVGSDAVLELFVTVRSYNMGASKNLKDQPPPRLPRPRSNCTCCELERETAGRKARRAVKNWLKNGPEED